MAEQQQQQPGRRGPLPAPELQQQQQPGRRGPLPAPEQQQQQPGRRAPLPAPEQQQQGPLPPLPAPVQREITVEDVLEAQKTVEKRGFPIPDNFSDMENTFWEFKKSDRTGNSEWDLVKKQCFNDSNLVGNKRRDILPLLTDNKKKQKLNHKQLARYRNELRGLEDKLAAKIRDFDQFVFRGFTMPKHFLKFPELLKKRK